MISTFVFCLAAHAAAPPVRAEVEGLILSVRGNMYVVRPSLRPKITRVLIGPSASVIGFSRTKLSTLKPGMRIGIGGSVEPGTGFHPRFIDSGWEALGYLVAPDAPLPTKPGFGIGFGKLKSVSPFVYTTQDGKSFRADVSKVVNVWTTYRAPRQGLLIGTRIKVMGTMAPDGVVTAQSVEPDRNATRPGTMFAEVVSVNGRQAVIRPKYSAENIPVDLLSSAKYVRENRIDPEEIKVGEPVTLWAEKPNAGRSSMPVMAIAVLRGPGRYPQSEGDEGGVYYKGRFVSLEPQVVFESDGKRMNLVIPAQIIVARLSPAIKKDMAPGQSAMFTLVRTPKGGWSAVYVVINASPWVGYGG